MNLKAIILKEITEVLGRDYWRALVLYPILFSGIGFYVFNYMVNQPQLQDPNIINFALELYLVIMPPFAMWLFNEQLIREKFGDEKLLRKFETILTTPVSLTTVWVGKIAAIFLLSYPLAILSIITVSLIEIIIRIILGRFDSVIVTFANSWAVIFRVPMILMTYASFAGWAILRFVNWERIVDLLFFLVLAANIAMVVVSAIFLTDGTTVPITNWQVVISVITGHVALFVLAFYLVSLLDREKVIFN